MSLSARNSREYPQRYRLEAGKCDCGKTFYPPRLTCGNGERCEFETTVLPREGKLMTWTVIRTPASQFTDEAPYAIGIVETGDARIMVQIGDVVDFDTLKYGMDMKLEFRSIQKDGHSGIIMYGHKAVPKL